jgi:hypothetical protein
MRRTLPAFLLVLVCCCVSVGQNAPQWKVIKHISVKSDAPIQLTTILTPTETSLYRITAYLTNNARPEGFAWQVNFNWQDTTGIPGAFSVATPVNGDSNINPSSGTVMFPAAAGTPVSYQVLQISGSSIFYLTFVVEQLQ